jgi:hypothetical protein
MKPTFIFIGSLLLLMSCDNRKNHTSDDVANFYQKEMDRPGKGPQSSAELN